MNVCDKTHKRTKPGFYHAGKKGKEEKKWHARMKFLRWKRRATYLKMFLIACQLSERIQKIVE